MQLQKLMLSGFRSWEAGVIEFTPGLTLITGSNGSGKTSIRMAAEYAVLGKVKGISKKQLAKEDSKSPLKVILVCTKDGKELSITRTAGKTALRVGDDVGVSVRESNFMAQLEVSMQHSFLSQEIQAFVDMQEYRRKEMLDSLIPEVDMLRGTCVPHLKNVCKSVSNKKYNVSSNIQQFTAVAHEVRANTANAQAHLEAEYERRALILAQQVALLPYTEEEHAENTRNLADVRKAKAELSSYMGQLSGWLEYADSVVGSDSKLSADVSKLTLELNMLTTKKDELEAFLTSDTIVEVCPHCKSNLGCGACGAPITSADKERWAKDGVAALVSKISACKVKLVSASESLAQVNVPDVESVHKSRADMRLATKNMHTLSEQLEALNTACLEYTHAAANVEQAKKLSMSDTVLTSMENNIAQFKEREQSMLTTIARKTHTWDVMNKLHLKLDRAVDAMYTVLPALYFGRLLSKLTLACNYLLSHISDKRVDMRADDKGIYLSVSGKEFSQLSFGEKQRVRVSITLAFSLLAVTSDTLFLDEVFDSALDAEGVQALGELLSGTMLQWYPKIIVVTHNKTLADALNPHRIVHITKEGGTSSMEVTYARQ